MPVRVTFFYLGTLVHMHELTAATSSFGPGPYYSVVKSRQFPALLN
jgi:hypothetical protein